MSRDVGTIAREVFTSWAPHLRKNPMAWPNYIKFSFPYLKEMLKMKHVTDPVGLEDGVMVVLYFLNNAHHWRGDDARRLKAELNQLIEESKK